MNKIENYFENIDTKQKLMIVATFFLCLFFVAKTFIPTLLEKQENLKVSIADTQRKISKKSPSKMKKQIALKQSKLLKQKSIIEEKKEDINYVMSNIYKIKYATFSESEFANTLDLILKNSVKRNLNIKSIKTLSIDDNTINIVKRKKSLQILGDGKYFDIVKFINYITNMNSLLSINSSVIELKKDKLEFILDVEIYGVGL